jgi:hypothetical protein
VSDGVGAPKVANRVERRRRPGVAVTRAAILDAARDEFATHDYDHATVRGIAAAAGVDQRSASNREAPGHRPTRTLQASLLLPSYGHIV